jgi:tRNA-2-methylthio-N6-dimethylallyladenosine synthase
MEDIAEMGNTQKLVYIETLGCQMNKSDSERILGILSSIGYDETEEIKEADLLIVNTCNIRQLSADKAYSRLGRWGQMKEHCDIKIAICGCVAQQSLCPCALCGFGFWHAQYI